LFYGQVLGVSEYRNCKNYLFLFPKWLLEIERNIGTMLAHIERWKSHFYSGFLLGLFFDPTLLGHLENANLKTLFEIVPMFPEPHG
jgi:hypothetical protein